MRPIGKVVAGDYKGKNITIFGAFEKRPFVAGFEIKSDVVESYEIVSQGVQKNKGGGLGNALIGGAFFGVAGAIAGGSTKEVRTEKMQVAIHWKDGKKSLIECNDTMWSILSKACF